jgi:hypothetical protein
MGKIGGNIRPDCLFQHFAGVVFVNRVDFTVVGGKIRLKSRLKVRQGLSEGVKVRFHWEELGVDWFLYRIKIR